MGSAMVDPKVVVGSAGSAMAGGEIIMCLVCTYYGRKVMDGAKRMHSGRAQIAMGAPMRSHCSRKVAVESIRIHDGRGKVVAGSARWIGSLQVALLSEGTCRSRT